MRITSFNVNGIRSFGRYVARRHGMTFNEYARDILKADILCVQETRGSPGALREFHALRDYITFTSTNRASSGRCGVSTMVSKRLYCRGMLPSPFSEEGRSVLTDHGEFKVLNLYFPFFDEDCGKDKSEVVRFYEEVGAFLGAHGDMVVCGDFNAVYSVVDHYQFYNELLRMGHKAMPALDANGAADGGGSGEASKKCLEPMGGDKGRMKACLSRTELPYEFDTVEALEAYFLEVSQRRWLRSLIGGGEWTDAFRAFCSSPESYTCWNTMLNLRTRNMGTRIDYVLVPKMFAHRLKDCGIQPEIRGSDHCPVYAEIDFGVLDGTDNVLRTRKNNLLDLFGI